MLVGLNLLQKAQGLQVGHYRLAGLVAVHALIFPAVFIDHTVVVQHPDGVQVVPQPHLEVVGVVGGGHFHAAGAELQIHVLVGHDGDLPVHQGQQALFADDILIPLVGGVDGHAGVAQHGLGPGGGHDDVPPRLPRDGVLDVPQAAGLVLVLHLRVA